VLTDRGRQQAGAAGAWLREQGLDLFDRHYCSPYVRTMQTAALLGLPDASWWLEPLLRERDRGYEYVARKEELAALFPHSVRTKSDDRFLWRPSGGESIPDVDLRLREVLATLAREMEGQRVICVTHEDFMDALRFRLEKMTIHNWIRLNATDAEPILNGGILLYTRRNPENKDETRPRFGWFRLVDPEGKRGFPWREIERLRFTNAELEAMAQREGTLFTDP
jgi:NAD+ kinase